MKHQANANTWIVRDASLTDAEAIASIQIASWRAAYHGLLPEGLLAELEVTEKSAFWREVLSSHHRVIVAESAGLVRGFCSVIPSRDSDLQSDNCGEITAFYVAPEFWRCGAGRRIFQIAETSGFSRMSLWVMAENVRALRFYSELGFLPDGLSKTTIEGDGFACRELRMQRCVATQR